MPQRFPSAAGTIISNRDQSGSGMAQYDVNGCAKNGRGGIRTHGTLLTYTHFPGVRLKPLGHPSYHRFQALMIEIRPLPRTANDQAPCAIRSDTRRTGRDSNSRYRVHRYAGFRDRCLQPLGHLSCSHATYSAARPTSTRTLRLEELLHQLSAFGCQDAGTNLWFVIESRVPEQIPNRSSHAGFFVPRAEHDTLDP